MWFRTVSLKKICVAILYTECWSYKKSDSDMYMYIMDISSPVKLNSPRKDEQTHGKNWQAHDILNVLTFFFLTEFTSEYWKIKTSLKLQLWQKPANVITEGGKFFHIIQTSMKQDLHWDCCLLRFISQIICLPSHM